MYKVVEFFTDLQDNNHPYHEGDIFPREGVKVSEDRLEELSSENNKRGVILIEEIPSEDIPEEGSEVAKEEPQKEEADVDSPKKPKAKKAAKKA